MNRIDHPAAFGSVAWLDATEGGRVSGPPTATVYAATCEFTTQEGQRESEPSAERLSILLQPAVPGDWSATRVGFLAEQLARPKLQVGVVVLVLEGPRTVGILRITEVVD
ncbi:hypothetical protein [Actinokineospora bangkokensis]|uniref:Uncharacterized protein n=1 Tax=Actinokineospora bangkokensis TaxID=1193682 RepID=A0A1Q9LIH2_9PSEU|nr:hypothetical protein [Actinokineospora bangkokensis]OLR91852.1 hypothetical protein BJP25_23735 [Actinokineospora bangkokensis]